MKKVVSLLSIIALLMSGFVTAQSFDTVLDWMFTNGLTKYNTSAEFRPFDSITRGEASKFVTKYAEVQGLEKTYTQCAFNDIAGYDYTLVPTIKEACEYALLKGSGTTFNPNGTLTEAQAITIVVRSLKGFLDETGDRRRQYYYEAGQELGIITNETLDGVNNTNITRQKMGTWFYKAAQVSNQQLIQTDGEENLTNILVELFGEVDLGN